MPFNLSFVLASSRRRSEVLAVPGALAAACQVVWEAGWSGAGSLHGPRMGTACSRAFVSFFKDVHLKMPRNNQLLHFAFWEDKQRQLQQVLLTLALPEGLCPAHVSSRGKS